MLKRMIENIKKNNNNKIGNEIIVNKTGNSDNVIIPNFITSNDEKIIGNPRKRDRAFSLFFDLFFVYLRELLIAKNLNYT